ncbi:hypothetical protein Ahia01_001197200, partial [Argonauta hians]
PRRVCSGSLCGGVITYASLFYNVFICNGLPISLGVLYPDLKATFHSSNAEAATTVSLAVGLLTTGSLLGGILCQRIGARKTIVLGSLLSFAGVFSSYFVNDIVTLMFTLGALMG